MLVTSAVSFAKKLLPEKPDWIEILTDNVIRLRLGDIDKLQKAFEKVELKNIYFEQEKPVLTLLCSDNFPDSSIKIEFFFIFFEGMSRSVTPIW